MALVAKNLLANAGDMRDVGLTPGSERSHGRGHTNPPQFSCWENPMDRGSWWATVHKVTKSQTRLKQLSMHAGMLDSSILGTGKDLKEKRERLMFQSSRVRPEQKRLIKLDKGPDKQFRSKAGGR